AVFDIALKALVLAFLLDYGTLHVAIEEVKRGRLVSLNGEAVPAEIQFCPARKIVLVLRLLWAVLEVAIVDRFRTPDLVNPYDHRVHRSKRVLAFVNQSSQGEAHNCKNEDGHLQIGIHHQRITIPFQVAFSSTSDFRSTFCLHAHRFSAHLWPRFSWLLLLRLHRGSYRRHCDAQAAIVSSCTASEQGMRHGRNLEKNVDVDQYEKDKKRQGLY